MASYMSGFTSYLKGLLWEDMEVSKVSGSYTTEAQRSASEEEKKNLWALAQQYKGMDVTSLLSVPVWIFEPTTFLVRMCEVMAFEDFLAKAGKADNPVDRLGWITAFSVAVLSTTERTGKPFNPILGETFEYVPKDNRFKFIAEQVSHHPPVGIAVTTSDLYTLKQETRVSTKFWGNSIEIYAQGHTEAIFPNGDHFVWISPTSVANNLVVGGMWVDHFGEVNIVDVNGSGYTCKIQFTRCGWFSEGRYEVNAEVFGPDGKPRMVMAGKWNEFLVGAKVDEHGKRSKEFDMWKVDPKVSEFSASNKWNLPPFVVKELLALDQKYEAILPDTDSRVRGDRLALELGDLDFASKEKTRLEEKQRADKKAREENGVEWKPVLFTKKEVSKAPLTYQWDYVGKYWEDRDARIKKYEEEHKQ